MEDKTKANFVTIILVSGVIALASVVISPLGGLFVLVVVLVSKDKLNA